MPEEHIHEKFEKDTLFAILSETEKLTNVGGWEWDTVKDKWIFSDNWLRLHGCLKRHLVTSELLQIAHPDDRPNVQKAFNAALSEGKKYNIEHRIIRQDTGEERFIKAYGKSILDSDGKVVQIIGAAQDITEFRQTEYKLRESEKKVESLVNNLPGVAYQFSMNTEGTLKFKYIGENCIKLFGIKANKIINDASLVFDLIPQPDADQVQKKIMTSAETLTPYDIEHRVVKKNGETVWIHAVSTPRKHSSGDIVWDGIGLDITKRRRAENALQESEQKFRAIFDDANDGILLGDAVTKRFVMANNVICRMLGYSKEEILNLSAFDIHPKEELHSVLEAFERQVREEIRIVENLPVKRKDGTVFYADINSAPISIGTKTFLMGIFRDITERKKAEDTLKQNEQRYKSAQHMGRVGNWEYDLLTGIFWGSDEAKRIYGFDAESKDFTTDEVERRIPERERVHQALLDLIEKGKPYDLEFVIHPINGQAEKIIHSIAKVVKNDSGMPIKVVGVIQDITERKQAENAFKEGEAFLGALIDAISVPIFYKNRDGQYLGFNKAFESFFGKTKEHLIGKSVFDVNPKDLAEIYHAKDKELFEKEGKQQYESQVKNADGELRNVIFNKSVYTNNQGSVVGLIGAISDITDRIQAETELRKSEEKFRILFESSKDPNYISTIEGIIIDANQALFDLFGYTKDDLHHLKTQDLYVNPEDRIAFTNEVERYGFAKDFEEKLRDKNGNMIDCQITATFCRSVDGTNNGYQGIIRDVTENKQKQIEREKLISELQDALAEIKTLSGLLPICSYCKKIRDDKGYWNQIEGYIQEHSDAEFSHSICRECAKKHYPDMDIYDD